MGMLIDGRWTENDDVMKNGAYERVQSVFDEPVGLDVIDAISEEPGRFHLIVSHSCPWSHRVLLIRSLKNLSGLLPVHIAHGPRIEGYAANGGASWDVPGSEQTIVNLHELYTISEPHYSGRSTVPILWDAKYCAIVSNESVKIMRALDAIRASDTAIDFTLYPLAHREAIDAINREIYNGLSNGVYRALFASSQNAYDKAVWQVFNTLDALDSTLSNQRYLLGDCITEADWRLFVTLLRFDSIYYVEHRCCFKRLTDYRFLWDYARDLYSWHGMANVVTLDALRQANYSIEPDGIVPVPPKANWEAHHDRYRLGAACIALRSGETMEVDPVIFTGELD
jgi:putative glutathione S-transferase